MNNFKIGEKVIFKEDYSDLIKKGSIAKITGFWTDGIEFKTTNEKHPINGACLYSRVEKLNNKDNNKIIVSKKVADSIEWLKKSKVTIGGFLSMLTGDTKLESLREEVQELIKLDKEDVLKAIFEGYEVEKEKLKKLPYKFKFKNLTGSPIIFYGTKIKNEVIISFINEKNEIESINYMVKECLDHINNGYWILID